MTEKQQKGAFISHNESLTMKDVLPLYHYLGFSENEMALFLGMRPESPYAEKYIANEDQELNHLQVFASRSLDLVVKSGIDKLSKSEFIAWIKTENNTLGDRTPKDLLLDVNEHDFLLEMLNDFLIS